MNLIRSQLLFPIVAEGVQPGTPTPREPRSRPTRPTASPVHVDPSGHYVRVELDSSSKDSLLKHFGPKYANAQGNHVTLSAQPTADELERYRKMHGQKVNFHATHHHHDDDMGVQAVRVHGLDHLSEKPNKHVTVSTNANVPALRSNELLDRSQGARVRVPTKDRRGRKRLGHLPLTGTVEIAKRLGKGS